uniref:Uncharacterized protein n=1 Tax=Glossina pallidipes TaxID=7398 RepID=A0A1B0AA94_GLOPL
MNCSLHVRPLHLVEFGEKITMKNDCYTSNCVTYAQVMYRRRSYFRTNVQMHLCRPQQNQQQQVQLQTSSVHQTTVNQPYTLSSTIMIRELTTTTVIQSGIGVTNGLWNCCIDD